MKPLAALLLLASTINAQFAGDAAAGAKREIATRPTNWLAQAHKKSAGAPKRKRWRRVKHIPATDPRSPFYVDPNAPKTAMASTARAPPPGAECRQYSSKKGVTIVTSATWGRVRQNLEPLCRRWRGPISVAMMLRVAVGRPDANEETQAKHIDQAHHMALSAGCTDVSIEAKTSPAESMFTRQFPVNLLRNLAWSKARTEYVLLLDIDFWPGLETRQALLDAINADTKEDRRAFIVPSFTLLKRLTRVDNPNPALYYKADSLVNRIPETLDDLTKCLAREITTPPRDVYCASFHFHGSTRVAHWLRDSHDPATNASLWDLPCTLHKYEPFVAVPRCGKPTMSPRFNTRFTGYGKNKISWFASLRAASFKFAPVKRAFATHMPHNLSKAHRQWAGIDVTGRAPLQDRVNKIYAQLMEDLGLFNAEAAEENLERLHYLREDEVATPDCGVSQKTSVDLEDFRNNDLREVAKACRAGDCDAARVLRVLDQRWTAVDNALEMPFAERVRAATVPVKYASKFGSSESTVAPHVLMRGGVESFDHFMRLEVGDMTPRDTGANKWAYDPRYNRALRRPDGVYNSKPRPQRVAPASQRRVATASRVNKTAASAPPAAPAKPTPAAPAAPAVPAMAAAAPPKAAAAPSEAPAPAAASPVEATAVPAVPARPAAPAAPAPVVASEAPAAPAVPASPVEAVAPAASAPVAVSKPPASPEKAAASPVAASKAAAPATPAVPATQQQTAATKPVVSETPVTPAAPAVASDAPAAPAVVASPVKAAAVPAASAPAAKPKPAAPEPVASTTPAAPATPAVPKAPLAPAVASASVAPATPPAAPSAPPMESVGRGED